MTLTSHQLMKLFVHDTLLLFGDAPELEARVTSASFLLLTGEPYAAFNVGAVLAHPDADRDLHELGAWLASRRLPAVLLLEGKVAPELAPVAHELGLQNEGCMPLMVLEPSTAPDLDEEYVIEQVRGPDDLAQANRISADAFSLSPESVDRVLNESLLGSFGVEAFIARRGGEPMSSVWTTTLGSVVGIWTMGTPPAYQRQGAGRALLSHVISFHLSRGARQFYLGSTYEGQPLYERMGFVSVAQPSIWMAPAVDQQVEQKVQSPSIH